MPANGPSQPVSAPSRATPETLDRRSAQRWRTALTSIAPNSILVRGYALDEMMGRLSFADAVYLLLMGELPTRTIGRMLDAGEFRVTKLFSYASTRKVDLRELREVDPELASLVNVNHPAEYQAALRREGLSASE